MRNCALVRLCLLLLACHCFPAVAAVAQRSADVVGSTPSQLGDVPLAFEPNQGQAGPDVRFVSRAQGLTVLIKDGEATLLAPSDGHDRTPALVHMKLVGGSLRDPVALEKQDGVSNYLMGDRPSDWRSGIPNFGRVRYASVYPGIDLDLYGNHRRLEHDFILAPRADYTRILVRLDGATGLSLGQDGSLQVETPARKLIFKRPEVYQYHGSKKIAVAASYLVAATNEFRFELGVYNHDLPLIIDPVLAYSTYLAGSSTEYGSVIAVDKQGDAYVTGATFSIDYPVSVPINGTCSNICQGGDVFVSKLSPAGAHLIYSTFVGGAQTDRPLAISVDGSGFAAVAGSTSSLDFPQKNGTAVVLSSFGSHGFVFELNPAGSAFSFSTYLGGEGSDSASGIATDTLGNVYASGLTNSVFFRPTPGTQIGPTPTYDNSNLFLIKWSRKGTLAFSTLVGGSSLYPGTLGFQFPTTSVVVNSAGESLVSGTALDGFPTTPGSYQPNYPSTANLNYHVFLAKFDGLGTSILSATYLGGTGGDYASGVALDSSGNVYVTGNTNSHDFPTTAGAFQSAYIAGPYSIGFVSKLDPALSSLTYSTFLGPTEGDFGSTSTGGIAVDTNGNSFVVGTTSEPSFPVVNPIIGAAPHSDFNNVTSAFLSVLNNSGSALTFSTFLSGSTGTNGSGVALNSVGDAFITGTTFDSDFPTTAGAFQSSFPVTPYSQHSFATKFSMAKANSSACLSSSFLFFGSLQPGQSSLPQSLTIKNCGSASLKVSGVTSSNPIFVVTQNTCKTVAAGASCAVSVRYSPTIAAGYDVASLQIKDNAPIPLQTVALSGYSVLPSIQVYATDVTLPDSVVGLTSSPLYIQIQTYGTIPVHITNATATGDFAASNQCPAELYPGGGCVIGVTFTPTVAGVRTGTLSILDDVPGSPQTVNLTGTGLSSYPIPKIGYLSPGSALVGSSAVAVSITGDNIFSTTKATINGKAAATNFDPAFGLRLTIPAAMMTSLADLAIQVVNPAPGGGTSAPVHFMVYKQIKIGASDVVYEPFTQRLYASIPARAASSPNTFVTVDPATGLLGAHVPVGNDPGAMGISSDGTTLYVALNGSNSIVPVNVGTRTPGTEIPLGSDPQRGPLSASAIQVQPGQPGSFVATLTGGFQGPDGIDWFKDGKLITQFLNEPPTNVALSNPLFVGSSDVYGIGGPYGGNGFVHFVLTSKGMLQAPGLSEDLGLGPFDTDGKNLYDITGQVFAASNGNLLGRLAGTDNFYFPTAVLTDFSSGRTFLLTPYNGILGFDSTSFAQVGSTGYFNFNPTSDRLLHWGSDGLAFLATNYFTNTYDLILMRTNLFYPAPGPNPLPVATSFSPASVTSKGPNFLLTVNGSHFVRGAVVLWNGATRTTKWINASKLIADIPAADIKAKGTAQITVSNPAPGGGASSAQTITIN